MWLWREALICYHSAWQWFGFKHWSYMYQMFTTHWWLEIQLTWPEFKLSAQMRNDTTKIKNNKHDLRVFSVIIHNILIILNWCILLFDSIFPFFRLVLDTFGVQWCAWIWIMPSFSTIDEKKNVIFLNFWLRIFIICICTGFLNFLLNIFYIL